MDIPGIPTGYIECRLAVTVNDGDDSGTKYDTIAPSGTVYLRPRRNAFTAETTIILPDTLSLPIDSEGYATVPDTEGNATSERHIAVPVVEGMTWTASFDLTIPAYDWQADTEENRVKIKPFDVPVETGKTTQIADYLPLGVDPSTGATWIKGDRGTGVSAARSNNGKLILTLDDGTELDPVDLPQGKKGDKGNTGPAPNLDIGTVKAGENEGDAKASVSGSNPNYKLDLTLPPGPKGNDGAGIPTGGTEGQVPIRTGDGGTKWSDVTSAIPEKSITEAMLDVNLDKPVGTNRIEDKAVTPDKLSDDVRQIIDDVKPTQADIVSKLEAPAIIAHRGGGKSVYPEQGLRGMIASAESGFLPEFDIQFLKDSTPVLCHDNTVNRTMTGVTGNVSNLTKEQWRSARLNPVYIGGRDDRPLLFEDVLDYLGGQTVLVPEIKKDATMAQVDVVIDLILERGLERAVLMQSFNYDACKKLADAGMEVVYLHGTGPSVSWKTMLDAGIRYWGPNRSNATTSKMDDAASAGIRVVPYTIEEPWHATALPKSVFGYFSNDPWGNSGRFGSYGTPRWAVGEGWPARRNTDETSGKVPGNWDGPQIWGTGLHIPRPNRLGSVSLEHLSGGFVSAPVRLEATFRYLPDSSSASANVGFHLIRNDQDDSSLYADKAVAGQQGYTIGMRRNGTLDAWEYVNGAAAAKVGANKGDAFVFAGDETGSISLSVELVGKKLTARCPTNGATFEADVSVTGSFRPYLRINSTAVVFESVSVTQI